MCKREYKLAQAAVLRQQATFKESQPGDGPASLAKVLRLKAELLEVEASRAFLLPAQSEDPAGSCRAPDAVPILYAVSHSDEGCELTVFENGGACSVVLSPALVEQLIAVLITTRSPEMKNNCSWFDRLLIKLALAKAAARGHGACVDDAVRLAESFSAIAAGAGCTSGSTDSEGRK